MKRLVKKCKCGKPYPHPDLATAYLCSACVEKRRARLGYILDSHGKREGSHTVPATRREILDYLDHLPNVSPDIAIVRKRALRFLGTVDEADTTTVSEAIGVHYTTVRAILLGLARYNLVECRIDVYQRGNGQTRRCHYFSLIPPEKIRISALRKMQISTGIQLGRAWMRSQEIRTKIMNTLTTYKHLDHKELSTKLGMKPDNIRSICETMASHGLIQKRVDWRAGKTCHMKRKHITWEIAPSA